MAEWLTFKEFTDLGGEATDTEFKKLIVKAQQTLSTETQGYYMTPEALEKDGIVFRKTRYKEALTQQVNFFVDSEATTAAQVAAKPVSQSIGDTSVSYGDRRSSANTGKINMVSQEALKLLADTGLLYRGATLCRHC